MKFQFPRSSVYKGIIIATVPLLCSQSALALINGSGHDFGTSPGGTFQTVEDEICIPCHTPHNAGASTVGPLWNHEISTASYTLYSSPIGSLGPATPDQPGPNSKLCLSCHDGTIAIDMYGLHAGSVFMTGAANLTTDLSNDHPVGLLWLHQTTGVGSEPNDCSPCHFGPPRKVVFFGSNYGVDIKMECGSCHDPHNTPGYDYLTVESMTDSLLCFNCHTDKW